MSAALLTPAQAAEHLGVPESRIRRLAQQHEIGHRRLGRFLRFTTDDLDAYVTAIAVAPTRAPGMERTRPRRQRRT